MENTQHSKESAATITNSNTIFGTSSDDILQDLHNGNLEETTKEPDQASIDKDQIVNTQDQHEIVNQASDETESITTTDIYDNSGSLQDEKTTLFPDSKQITDVPEADPETETPLKRPGGDEIRTEKDLPKM
ncbi:MAG: hypothetical protein WKF97_16730 [Chitinophagaceae bacterium]